MDQKWSFFEDLDVFYGFLKNLCFRELFRDSPILALVYTLIPVYLDVSNLFPPYLISKPTDSSPKTLKWRFSRFWSFI
jgi:hypothetical protein